MQDAYCEKKVVMQGKRKIIYILLLSLSSIYGHSQKLDSLLQALDIYQKEDTFKLNLLNSIEWEYLAMKSDRAQETITKAITLAQKLKVKNGLAKAYKNEAIRYENEREYTKAAEYFQKALSIYADLGDEKGRGNILNLLGYTYWESSNYPKALEYFHQAIRINTQLDNERVMASNFGGLGLVYNIMSDYTKALTFHQESLKIWERLNDKSGIGYNLVCIGRIYTNLSDYNKSIEFYNSALNVLDQTIDTSETISALEGLGKIYYKLSNYEKALTYFRRALILSRQIGYEEGMYVSLAGLGITWHLLSDEILIRTGEDPAMRFDKSLEYLNQSLQIAIDNKLLGFQTSAWENLSNFYQQKKDYPKALEAYKNFIALRDSIVNDEKRKQIAYLDFQYEFNKKEDSLKQQQLFLDVQLQQQLLIAQQQQQQIELKNKENQLQKLAYLKTQADLQNEKLQNEQKIKLLNLSEKEKQLQAAQLTTLSQENKVNTLTQQRLWLLAGGGFSLVIFAALFILYRTRLRQVQLAGLLAQQQNEQQIKEAEFQHKLGDITLSALRSQMNPHFIFNCLNSIKLYAAQNDSKAASDYLTKFSRLIRQMLENSRSERISLANEIQSLELYIQMEAMRFKEKLSYNITVENSIDLHYIEIPPLLIQPYVENAIWHGLMQKEQGGLIDVHISKNDTDDMLTAIVTDNGIGRKKSTELKSKSATRHKSYGMKVTSERIALINQVYKSNTTVQVSDLYDEAGEPAGTRVMIRIPI